MTRPQRKVADCVVNNCLLALDVLSKMPSPVVEICGPATTNKGSAKQKREEELAVAIVRLQNRGYRVFNSIPYHRSLMANLVDWGKNQKLLAYYRKVTGQFFLPVLSVGIIKRVYLLPNWQESLVARWEREILRDLAIPCKELPANWLTRN